MAKHPSSRRRRVLAAEDNLASQVLLRAFLEPLDLDVVLVADGRSAFEAFVVGPAFDVIFLDIQMPVLSGLVVAQYIRRYEVERGIPPTPIIALTGNASERQIAECKLAGMSHFVAKPVSATALYLALQGALERRDL